ncbi:hypothetical protein H113_03054 [Trichophyton rubrum MR1459]|nr:hypothetical protein H113_03054 [Trichophyton rubrum MR1459]EZG07591.1 hypothetical protein H106_02884 [Trichophyton rubrum CBS 735.88]
MRRWNSIVSSWRPGDSAARVVTRRFIFPSRVVSSCLTMSLLDEGNKLPKLGGVEGTAFEGITSRLSSTTSTRGSVVVSCTEASLETYVLTDSALVELLFGGLALRYSPAAAEPPGAIAAIIQEFVCGCIREIRLRTRRAPRLSLKRLTSKASSTLSI